MDINDTEQEVILQDDSEEVSYNENETDDTVNNDISIELFPNDIIKRRRITRATKHSTLEEENETLRKELIVTQEKFSLLQMQVQHQDKLIELLCRLDMQRSGENQDKKEIEDLQSKIQIVTSLVQELTMKFNDVGTDKRRLLIASNTNLIETPVSEKKAAIWEHFTISTGIDGQKNAECNYCKRVFNCRSMNANKCREHIYERCTEAPNEIKKNNKPHYDVQAKKAKYPVWNYFINEQKDGKSIIVCSFCRTEYSSRNATKCREHVAFKCPDAPDDAREAMRSTFSQDYIDSLYAPKRSSIWEHFSIVNEDDKSVIQCIYCCLNYANKNATKCREHLLERCDKIPLYIRHKINHSFFETPLKTWTQIKIPIWEHFSIVSNDDDRSQYKCNYCKKLYVSKNVTKFRAHLLEKCESIPDGVKAEISYEVASSSTNPGQQNTFKGDSSFTEEDQYDENENDRIYKNEDHDHDEVEDEEESRMTIKRLKTEPAEEEDVDD